MTPLTRRRTLHGLATLASLLLAMAGCSAIASFEGLVGDPTVAIGDASPEASVPDSGSAADGSSSVDAGTDAGTRLPVSCVDGGSGTSATCGATKADDCCAVAAVPGGSYNRSNEPSHPATVSSFILDREELTIGRFRRFVSAGLGTAQNPPAAGAGAHPKISGSGWDPAWNGKLPLKTSDLAGLLHCGNSHWTDTPDAYESYPASCMSWYVAFAFCAWDGGRLPTEAEWNFAAAGGNEQRNYAWSTPPGNKTIDPTYATYGCYGHGGTPPYNEAGAPICSADDILPVGVHSPKGDGKWGHADLSGSMWEWTLDAYVTPYATSDCTDCANTDWSSNGNRVFRSGDYDSDPSIMVTAYRSYDSATGYADDRGIRCARDP